MELHSQNFYSFLRKVQLQDVFEHNYRYILLSYTLALELPTCVLFISLTQLLNSVHFLNITFLLVLFAAAPAADVSAIVIVLLIGMYASL